jgi:hypothetical protein
MESAHLLPMPAAALPCRLTAMLLKAGEATLGGSARADKEAARARRLEGIYHLGQQRIWDGREVLREAFVRFPAPPEERLGRREREALAKVFAMLMWGELAAWRVSAQLADMVTDTEQRMAATAQAHDEARHYYVLHDYLSTLRVDVPPLDPYTRVFLNACISTRSPLNKVVGMQLFVETIALTIFKMVRQVNVDPALGFLLTYYERDEARHVGFGVQALPGMLVHAGARGRAGLWVFEAKVLGAMLLAIRNIEAELGLIGVPVRDLLEDGGQRFATVVAQYREELGGRTTPEGQLMARLYEAVTELSFPLPGQGDAWNRIRRAWSSLFRPSALG